MDASVQENIILVDEHDNEIGTAEKLAAHRNGQLHRAFSIFIFNTKAELMLQKRAATKYHSAGLWTNTCCSHPRAGEDTVAAAHRRLREEMGFDCPLEEKFQFTYQVKFDNGLTENEFDHVFVGSYDGEPDLNPAEASAWQWMSLPDVKRDIAHNPNHYSHWIKIVIDRF